MIFLFILYSYSVRGTTCLWKTDHSQGIISHTKKSPRLLEGPTILKKISDLSIVQGVIEERSNPPAGGVLHSTASSTRGDNDEVRQI